MQEHAILGLCGIGTPEAAEFLKTREIEILGGQPKYVGAAAAEHKRQARQKTMRAALMNMVWGAIVAGVGFFAIYYYQHSEGRIPFYVWGAIVIGLIDLGTGIRLYLKARLDGEGAPRSLS